MKDKRKKFIELVNKHLVGKRIVKVEWLSPKLSQKLLGWDQQPCEIHLEDGIVITPSQDDEGNGAGALFTNLKDLPTIPVFRD